jgi:hypothetical protein
MSGEKYICLQRETILFDRPLLAVSCPSISQIWSDLNGRFTPAVSTGERNT